jgi:hypothetical protein
MNGESPELWKAKMPESVATLEGTLRSLRIIHGCLMFAIVLYVYVLRAIPEQPSQDFDPRLPWILGIVAAVEVAIALFVRVKKLGPAFEMLRSNPAETGALLQWRMAVIISDALAISVALYGLVLHLVGFPDRQAVPFFVAGSAVMILWWPRRP